MDGNDYQGTPGNLADLKVFTASPTPPTPICLGRDLIMSRYESLPPGNLPEFVLADYHALAVIDLDSAAIFEEKIGNICYPRQLKGYGSCTLVPAGISHQVSWEQPINLTTYYLHTSLFSQMATERLHSGDLTLMPKSQTKDPSLYYLAMALQNSLLNPSSQSSPSAYHQMLMTSLVLRLLTHHSSCPPVSALPYRELPLTP
ncbi:MAG: hypothetical protein LVS60_08525 [Nodosilinea sp. LVE1205-7]